MTIMRSRIWASGLSGLALALAGCASHRSAPVATIAPVRTAPARPTLPAGYPARLVVPAIGADGQYVTINRGLSNEQMVWHVRSALNVAALSCRGAGEAALVADYNGLLKREKATLAATYTVVQQQFRATGGRDWQTGQDAHVTRVYNFFAQPTAQQAFCAVATTILNEAEQVSPADFPAFARAALPRLEAPFTDVYRTYDGYHRDLAAWDARYGPGDGGPVSATPRLEYASIDQLMAWTPPTGNRRLATNLR